MSDQTITFPPGFLWGTATSAHQVEGNNTNNDWWAFESLPGAIWHGDRSGLACDWWRNAETDLDLMAELKHNTHRLSIEWSRVQPTPDHWNENALDRYREVTDEIQHVRADLGYPPLVTPTSQIVGIQTVNNVLFDDETSCVVRINKNFGT